MKESKRRETEEERGKEREKRERLREREGGERGENVKEGGSKGEKGIGSIKEKITRKVHDWTEG